MPRFAEAIADIPKAKRVDKANRKQVRKEAKEKKAESQRLEAIQSQEKVEAAIRMAVRPDSVQEQPGETEIELLRQILTEQQAARVSADKTAHSTGCILMIIAFVMVIALLGVFLALIQSK